MWHVLERLPEPAPPVLGVKALPILTDRRKSRDVVAEFAVAKEIQVNGASLEVDAVHRLTSARLDIDGLLFWGTGKFTARDYKAQLGRLVDEFGDIQ